MPTLEEMSSLTLDDMVGLDPNDLYAIADAARLYYDKALCDVEEAYDHLSNYGPRPFGEHIGVLQQKIADIESRQFVDKQELQFYRDQLAEALGGKERVHAEDVYLQAVTDLGSIVSTATDAMWLATTEGQKVVSGRDLEDKQRRCDNMAHVYAHTIAKDCWAREEDIELFLRETIARQAAFAYDGRLQEYAMSVGDQLARQVPPATRDYIYRHLVETGMAGVISQECSAHVIGQPQRTAAFFDEIRHFGKVGTDRDWGELFNQESDSKAAQTFGEALSYYPDALIDDTFRNLPFQPIMRHSTQRAYAAACIDLKDEGPKTPLVAIRTPYAPDGDLNLDSFAAHYQASDSASPLPYAFVTAEAANDMTVFVKHSKGMPFLGQQHFTDTLWGATVADTPHNREKLEKVAQLSKNDWGSAVEVVSIPGPRSEMCLALQYVTPIQSEHITTRVKSMATTNGALSTSIHEMAHLAEAYNPRIGVACKRFVEQRTDGKKYDSGSPTEPYISDGFIDPYVSRTYFDSAHHTEVLSTGMEYLYEGIFSDPRGNVKDAGHRNLVAGLLASLASPRST